MRARKKEIGSKLIYIAITLLCCVAVVTLSLKAFYFNDKNDTPVNMFNNEQQQQQEEQTTTTTNTTMQTDKEPEVDNSIVNNNPTTSFKDQEVKIEEIGLNQDTASTDEEEINPPINDEEWVRNYLSNISDEAVARFDYDINDHQPTFGETVYAKENETGYTYGKRMYPTVDIKIPEEGSSMKNYTDEVDTSNFQYYGDFRITGYSPYCAHCCGGSTSGLTASGNNAVCGYTVSCTKDIPFGTTLYIEGYGFYVVEDRGVPYKDLIDIACPTHEDCYPITGYDVPVYIVSYGTDNNA